MLVAVVGYNLGLWLPVISWPVSVWWLVI